MHFRLPNIPTEFLRKALSDNGTPSSSRLLAVLHSFAAVFCLVYVTIKNHAIPDGTVTAGLGAFATAPYAINRVSGMFGGQKKDQGGGDADTAARIVKE